MDALRHFRNLSALLLLLTILGLAASGTAVAEQAPVPSAQEMPSAALADILENEEARARLIADLRQAAEPLPAAEEGGATDGESAPDPEAIISAPPPVQDLSLPRKIARATQNIAEEFVGGISGGMAAIRALSSEDPDAPQVDMAKVLTAVINLLIVVVATIAAFIVLRRLARPLFRKASDWALRDAERSLLRRTTAIVGSAVLDLLIILIAWVGGYMLALFAIGEPGMMEARESLFLNAFLLIEVFKAFIRMLFAAHDDGLRLLPMPAEEAAYWNAWLAKLSSFIGYGILLVVPMINVNISPAVGKMTTLIVMAIAFFYALVVIMQNRQMVRDRLQVQAQGSSMGLMRVLLGMLARSWHVLVIGYFLALTVVTVLRPEDALPLMLEATLKTFLAIGGGVFLSVVLTQAIGRPIKVPEETRLRFPMLEQRLNGFIPTALKVIRLVILIVVIALVLDAWGLFNLAIWLGSEAGINTVGVALSIAVILTLSTLLWIGIASWIEQRLNPATGSGEPSAREKTLLTIFRNAVAITMIIITAMIVLSEVGVDIGPLIAGAGVLGLAIGFGAQKLVQDVITGVFIQLENAINAGDIVTAAGVTGTAERLTIRSLGIRDLAGTYHMIPFSSVDTVANYMREFAYHVGEYGVAYRENTDDVIVRLREAFDELVSDPEQRVKILGELEVHGVTALADSSVNIRVRIKTLPGVQWAVGREYNRLVKRHLDAAGIEIPFPHLTLYFGQDKDGGAPPAPLLIQQPSAGRLATGPGQQPDPRSKSDATEKEDFDEEN